jgi:hypothetical protein
MRVQSAVLAMAMAFGMLASGCNSGSGSPSGTGGSSGAGGAGESCSNVTPCGGGVVGTWTVTSSCLTVSGQLDLTLAGLNCPAAAITGSLHVSGTWTGNADGTYSDNTTTTGTEQFALASACLFLSGTTTTCDGISGPLQGGLGFKSVNCTTASSGGCTCTATVEQSGGVGLVSVVASGSGNFESSGKTVTIDTSSHYSYCVSGSKMTWTPQPASPTTTGTVVFQASGTSGTGGMSGTAGATGSGGGVAGNSGGMGGRVGTGGRTGSGGTTGTGGSTGAGGSTTTVQGPCDIYGTANTPCVAAYSTTRILSSKYTGPLYQVRRGGTTTTDGTGANMKTGVRGGGTTMDIGVLGGFADSAAQDTFCGTDTCTFSIIYDQSGKGNNLRVAPAGCFVDGSANLPDYESSAKQKSTTVSGRKVYALYTNAREGYRNDTATGVPSGANNAAQGIYEVADATHAGTACCWDFGNVGKDDCNGTTMNTLFFGTGFWGKGAGSGPWFMADLEGGVWSGGTVAAPTATSDVTPTNISMAAVPFAFGVLKTSAGQYALRMGNAQSGTLTTGYDGAAPNKNFVFGGAVVLGVGGDNSNHSFGTFYEGAVTMGRPADATDAAVLANVQAAGYGK